MSALKYWLWLTTRTGVDTNCALRIVDHFMTPERAYYADASDYEMLSLPSAARRSLLDKNMEKADRILGDCDRLGLRIITLQDAEYPQRLKQIGTPPPVLYVRGRLFAFDEEAAIGVVGAREPSAYGERYAGQFGMELARGGALLVSGMAQGVDACAIRGALKAGGSVVSMLANGLDVVYPKYHRNLYEDVAAVGALMSEYPPGTSPVGHHFPHRNRIISGLSLGVLAVECRRFSGTMTTIQHALDQDRDVFAVPGGVDAPMSEGTNWLIQQGAKLVTCAEDILVEYREWYPLKLQREKPLPPKTVRERLEDLIRHKTEKEAAPKQEEPEQKVSAKPVIPRAEQKARFTDDGLAVLFAMGENSYTIDELVERTQIPTRRVLSTLTVLQIEGVVEERSGKRFGALVTLEE